MSYILDALTKSQRERPAAEIPTLSTPQLAVEPARGLRIGTGGSFVLAISGAALMVSLYALLGQESAQTSSPALATPARQAAEAGAGQPVPMSISPSAPSDGRLQPPTAQQLLATSTQPVADGGAPSPPAPRVAAVQAGRRPTATPRAAARKPPAPVRSLPRPAPPVSGVDTVADADPPVSPETIRLIKDLLAIAERPEPLPAPDPPPAAPPVQAPASAAQMNRPYGVNELPAALRAGIGALTINAHLYAEAVTERLVIINMKRYRQGERLQEGPRVEAITPTGVVLSHQSQRFRLDAR